MNNPTNDSPPAETQGGNAVPAFTEADLVNIGRAMGLVVPGGDHRGEEDGEALSVARIRATIARVEDREAAERLRQLEPEARAAVAAAVTEARERMAMALEWLRDIELYMVPGEELHGCFRESAYVTVLENLKLATREMNELAVDLADRVSALRDDSSRVAMMRGSGPDR